MGKSEDRRNILDVVNEEGTNYDDMIDTEDVHDSNFDNDENDLFDSDMDN